MSTKKEYYTSPIRDKTKVITVYASKPNHKFLKEHLTTVSMSQFIDRLITLCRNKDHDFANLVYVLQGRHQPHANAHKFKNIFERE